MKQYDKYKPSEVEWIGDIPKDWKIIKIKYSTYVKGRVGWNGLKSSEFLQAGYSYLITGTDFKNGLVDLENCYYIDKERYKVDPLIQLKENDLLITKDGTIGKTALVKDLDKPACLNSGIFVTRPLNEVYTTPFMYWILNSQEFKKFFDYTSRGSTILHLYQNVFENFIFTYPALAEQKKITAYLNKEILEIDKIIADKENLIKLLEEEKEIIISNAVTKGLTQDVEMQDSGIDWLGYIPKTWKITRAKYISKIFIPQRNKPILNEFKGLSWVTIDEIKSDRLCDSKNKVTLESIAKVDSKILPEQSVIASCVGEFGICAINDEECVINQQLQAFTYIQINPEYLLLIVKISKLYFISIATEATISYVNKTGFENMPVLMPSEKEQQNIVNFLDKKTDETNQIIQTVKDEIKLLKEYKETLIYEVITGKIDVREEVVS